MNPFPGLMFSLLFINLWSPGLRPHPFSNLQKAMILMCSRYIHTYVYI